MSSTSALYPPPPPYIRFFSDENVAKVKKLREDGVTDEEIAETKDLRFQIPPKQPDRPTYRSFGDMWPFEDRFITLEESGVPQLYSGGDKGDEDEEEVFTQERIEELKKLTKSLLLNFLELVGILAKNPHGANGKIDQIRIILINLHHLLNSYRLHQSRESLILRIQEKLRKDVETIDRIEQTCKDVEAKIKMLAPATDHYDSAVADDTETLLEDARALKGMKEQAVKEIAERILTTSAAASAAASTTTAATATTTST